jgi:hypothetical protein
VTETTEDLIVYTIYCHPLDYPEGYTVTRWRVTGGHEPEPVGTWHAANSLDAARALVPPGLHRMERDPNDDDVIVESWL